MSTSEAFTIPAAGKPASPLLGYFPSEAELGPGRRCTRNVTAPLRLESSECGLMIGRESPINVELAVPLLNRI